jgi:IclR family transcriptional regulator, KDG regulon repressor
MVVKGGCSALVAEKKGVLMTVSRAMDLLNCFSYEKPEWSLSDLSRELKQPKSVVSRLLTTLKEGDFVEQNSRTKKYQLGIAIFHLGAVMESHMDLRRQAYDPMLSLAEATSETVLLSILDHNSSVCVEKIDSPHTVKVMAEVGRRLELYAGAPHKMLLAYFSPEELEKVLPEKMVSYGPNAPKDVDTLKEQLELIRKRGYAISQEERSPGVGSISAPIRNKDSRVIASLSLAIPLNRFTSERIPDLIDDVRSHARQISLKIGWRP